MGVFHYHFTSISSRPKIQTLNLFIITNVPRWYSICFFFTWYRQMILSRRFLSILSSAVRHMCVSNFLLSAGNSSAHWLRFWSMSWRLFAGSSLVHKLCLRVLWSLWLHNITFDLVLYASRMGFHLYFISIFSRRKILNFKRNWYGHIILSRCFQEYFVVVVVRRTCVFHFPIVGWW